MILFIVFVGVVVVIGIVSNANKNHSKSNEHNHHIHSTNEFSTNDAYLSSQTANSVLILVLLRVTHPVAPVGNEGGPF